MGNRLSGWTLGALLGALLMLGAPLGAQTTAADSAWVRGDTDLAARLYGERLAADSTDLIALRRIATVRAWAGAYDESVALFDRLLRMAPADAEAALERARVLAWRRDYTAALGAVDEILAGDPGFRPALEARAQFTSWTGQYDQSIQAYRLLRQAEPKNRELALAEARVHSWARHYERSLVLYDSLMTAAPADREVLLGLAQTLAWSTRYDSAAVVYGRILAADPTNLDALRGWARSASWSGDLAAGEARWRRALDVAPEDVPSLVGLAATLRWQGRNAAALDLLQRAARIAPEDTDLREQLQWVRAAIAPRAGSHLVYERDSDGNRIATLSATGAWHPAPRWELRMDAYLRRLGLAGVGEERESRGAALTLWRQWEPGWVLSGTIGGTQWEASPAATVRAALSTPTRGRAGATLAYSRAALDATSMLVQQEVMLDEWTLSTRLSPAPAWTLQAVGGTAEFSSRASGQENRRISGTASVSRKMGRSLALGATLRSFGFEEDRNDGYFDPDFYAVAEAVLSHRGERNNVAWEAEVGPGIQQVGSTGEPSGAFRGSASLAYVLAPGRRLSVGAVYANTGIHQIAAVERPDYAYQAVTLSGSWVF